MGGGLLIFGCVLIVVIVVGVMMRVKKLNKKFDEQQGWIFNFGDERGWRYKYQVVII